MSEQYLRSALSQIRERSSAAPINIGPIVDRACPSVPSPATQKPTDAEFYQRDENGTPKPNHEFLKQHFFREGRLTEAQAIFILDLAIAVMRREENLVQVKSPVTICGDIHGQYYDLMKLFDVGGHWDETTYVFLGDYVDRGYFGIECLLYLYSLKIWYPKRFVLLRGNHECRHLTEYFTFKRECLHKYSVAVYEKCIESFCALPITALVDGRFFCVHGGISPELMKLDDLKKFNRFTEPGSTGLLCDLLWADPIANFGQEQPNAYGSSTFVPNATRGCSYFFTYEAACKFLDRNGLLGIIRGHEAQDAGYTMHRKTPSKKFPSVITIFSAPNYLDVYHNRGAILKYANKNITIRQFNASPHPYWLPNFMDAFTWSLPFVGTKITEMLLAILSICSQEELVDSESDDEGDTKNLADAVATSADRRQQIKNKILAVGRMQRVFQLLREEAENASELVVEMPGGLPATEAPAKKPDALTVHGIAIKKSIQNFEEARRLDMVNERLPMFEVAQNATIFPAPSMRITSRRNSADSLASEGGSTIGNLSMEYLIKKTLQEDEAGGLAERLAENMARPRKLKRYETA
ncbi:hypothetical protein AX16_000788 [Volvariella volvacea WC 439]|nr:hypothetical protein AX16_000788 [Volvariella volvacea WC 439]